MRKITEKIELIGAGLYDSIPDELTIHNMPTISDLDYIPGDSFESKMIDTILPYTIEEKINFRDLLEIDFQWLCRWVRIFNYGPYFTTRAVFCGECGTSNKEVQVDVRNMECKDIADDFLNDITIAKENFLDAKYDIHVRLLTIQQVMNMNKDKAFKSADGKTNRELARICYMISSINGKSNLTPMEVKMIIQNELSASDYTVLRAKCNELTDYGLRAGGKTTCPECGNENAAFLCLIDEKFFTPKVEDITRWIQESNANK